MPPGSPTPSPADNASYRHSSPFSGTSAERNSTTAMEPCGTRIPWLFATGSTKEPSASGRQASSRNRSRGSVLQPQPDEIGPSLGEQKLPRGGGGRDGGQAPKQPSECLAPSKPNDCEADEDRREEHDGRDACDQPDGIHLLVSNHPASERE